jgi:hypothetical protein
MEIESIPAGTTHGPLPEHITLIVLDSAVAEKGDKILFKVAFPVMPVLVLNVFPHGRDLRRANTERAASLLPGKALPIHREELPLSF